MSNYTTQLRFICERLSGLNHSTDYAGIKNVIDAARSKIFDFPYPLYDNAYRPVLETKILKHFYTREIGEETYGLWKLRLDDKLNLIMPYYNELYKSAMLEYNPLYDVDYIEERQGTKDGTHDTATSGDATRTSSGSDNRTLNTNIAKTGTVTTDIDNLDWQMYSDTPQGSISNLNDNSYLTNATKTTADDTNETTYNTNDANTGTDNVAHSSNEQENTTGTETGNYRDTEQYITHVFGKTGGGNYSALIKDFRETIINIDLLILNDLSDLFINLY